MGRAQIIEEGILQEMDPLQHSTHEQSKDRPINLPKVQGQQEGTTEKK